MFELRILRDGAVQIVHRDSGQRMILSTQGGFADCYDVIKVTYSWSSTCGAEMRVDNMTDGQKCKISSDLIGMTFEISNSETFVRAAQKNDEGMHGLHPDRRIDYVAILDKPVLMDGAVTVENVKDAPLADTYEMAAGDSGDDADFDAVWIDLDATSVPQYETMTPCFTPGTLIATPKGERKVEELEIGDRVITRDNGIREIRWVGRKLLTGAQLAREDHLRPILIRAGALGVNLPERDMMVSPNHRILVSSDKTALYFEEREVLVAAKHLTGLDGVDMVDVSSVTYVHFMFDQHEMVLSDGAWTESFQPCNQSLKGIGNAQRNEIFELFPMLKTQAGLTSYPPARRTLDRYEALMLLQ
ncbi:Hint domain-containing protein [Arenibacterium sp. CAU 1754]